MNKLFLIIAVSLLMPMISQAEVLTDLNPNKVKCLYTPHYNNIPYRDEFRIKTKIKGKAFKREVYRELGDQISLLLTPDYYRSNNDDLYTSIEDGLRLTIAHDRLKSSEVNIKLTEGMFKVESTQDLPEDIQKELLSKHREVTAEFEKLKEEIYSTAKKWERCLKNKKQAIEDGQLVTINTRSGEVIIQENDDESQSLAND